MSAIFGSLSVAGFFGATTVSLGKAYLDQRDQLQSDARWERQNQHGQDIAELKMRVKQHDDLLVLMDVRKDIGELKAELRILNLRITRKMVGNGGL